MRITKRATVRHSLIAFAVMLVATAPAPAFYWSTQGTPSILAPGDQGKPGNPPISSPIPFPPETVDPKVPLGPPDTPGNVPEPATSLCGLIGVGLLSLRRMTRRK